MKEKIREILIDHEHDFQYGNESPRRDMAEAITVHVMEFIEWKDKNSTYDEEDGMYFTTTDEMMGIGSWLTLEAVYGFWLNNVKK